MLKGQALLYAVQRAGYKVDDSTVPYWDPVSKKGVPSGYEIVPVAQIGPIEQEDVSVLTAPDTILPLHKACFGPLSKLHLRKTSATPALIGLGIALVGLCLGDQKR